MNAVVTESLTRTYGSVRALDGISLQIPEGCIFGLIGPDGAGKTTLLRILATLLLPSSGRASVLGSDIKSDYRAIRKILGYMPGRFSLYPDLTIRENINFYATLFGTTPAENNDSIGDIYKQLAPFEKRRAQNLSGGMKQKLALCCALVHRPRILLLDEPTTGVDPVSRREFWDILVQLRTRGMTTIVATPYMDEAARCDTIAFLRKGQILAENSPAGMISLYPGKLFVVSGKPMARLLRFLRSQADVKSCYSFGNTLHLRPQTNDLTSDYFYSKIRADSRFTDVRISLETPSVEDCYLQFAGNYDDDDIDNAPLT